MFSMIKKTAWVCIAVMVVISAYTMLTHPDWVVIPPFETVSAQSTESDTPTNPCPYADAEPADSPVCEKLAEENQQQVNQQTVVAQPDQSAIPQQAQPLTDTDVFSGK